MSKYKLLDNNFINYKKLFNSVASYILKKENLANFFFRELLLDKKEYKHYFFDYSRNSLFAALKLCNAKRVGYPAFCVDLVKVIIKAGATPILVEADINTFNIDVNKIPREIDALVCVHTFGNPVDIKEIKSRYKKLIIIEDCTHALYSSVNGCSVGALADFSFFSFHKQIKNIETGSILIFKKKFYKKIYQRKRNIVSNLVYKIVEKIRNYENTYVNISKENNNLKLDFISSLDLSRKSSILSELFFYSNLDNLESEILDRRKVHSLYIKEIKKFNNNLLSIQKINNFSLSSHLVFSFLISKKYNFLRDVLVSRLNKIGIETSTMWDASPVSFSDYKDDYKNAESLSKGVFNIPINGSFSRSDVRYLIKSVFSEFDNLVSNYENKRTDLIGFKNFKNKIVFISGASGGFGLSMVKQFLDKGAIVLAQYNSNEKKLSLLKNQYGDKLQIFYMDYSDNNEDLSYDQDKLINYIRYNFNRVDIVVNNAAVAVFGEINDLSDKSISEILRINMLSHILLTKKLLQFLKNGEGMIIGISSESILSLPSGVALYTATKAGLSYFHKSLSKDLYYDGVKVFTFSPSKMSTSMSGYSGNKVDLVSKKLLDLITGKIKIKSGDDFIL